MIKQQTKWKPLFRVEKVLENTNYIVRKVNINITQYLQQMTLTQIEPQIELKDWKTIDSVSSIQPHNSWGGMRSVTNWQPKSYAHKSEKQGFTLNYPWYQNSFL